MNTLTYDLIDSREVAVALDKISNVVKGMSESTVAISCIAIAVLMQKPDIDMPTMIEIVKSVSEYIALTLPLPTTGTVN